MSEGRLEMLHLREVGNASYEGRLEKQQLSTGFKCPIQKMFKFVFELKLRFTTYENNCNRCSGVYRVSLRAEVCGTRT
jgi:hypothetical protein